MTRCIETSRKDATGLPGIGDATNPDSRGSANCGPSARSESRFYADRIPWNSRSTDNVRCRVGVAAGAVKRPRFSSNLSTFMFNCILVVTTLERNVSGRCRTTILPQAHAYCPVRMPSRMGLFPCSTCSSPRRLFAPRLTQMSFCKYNPAVVKTPLLPLFERIRVTLNSR